MRYHKYIGNGTYVDSDKAFFEDLFVLEMANNHWGSVERGLRIIADYSKVVRFNNVKAAIKLQFRDVPTFIHKDFLHSEERYIKKTRETALTQSDFQTLIEAVHRSGCIAMATPFDETSVSWCRDVDIVKIASSDINDWFLIEAIAKLRKPVIISTGGSSQKDIDDLVLFFEHRDIPLAINHCVALYPTEDGELDLNQIDFLIRRYPGHVIGLSSHEHCNWEASIMIAYAKGARTFERHIDIDLDPACASTHADRRQVSPYCSLPHQIDIWFKAWKKVREMCGAAGAAKRIPEARELAYLHKLLRGVYAKQGLPTGHVLTTDDVYLAIPLQAGQLSCRTFMTGEVLARACGADEAVSIDMIETPYGDARRQESGVRSQES